MFTIFAWRGKYVINLQSDSNKYNKCVIQKVQRIYFFNRFKNFFMIKFQWRYIRLLKVTVTSRGRHGTWTMSWTISVKQIRVPIRVPDYLILSPGPGPGFSVGTRLITETKRTHSEDVWGKFSNKSILCSDFIKWTIISLSSWIHEISSFITIKYYLNK